MKKLLVFILGWLTANMVNAETVLFPPGPSIFHLDVATNKALVIHDAHLTGSIIWSNKSKICQVSRIAATSPEGGLFPIIACGPISLLVTNVSSTGFISYSLMPSLGMQTMMYQSTGAVFMVPANMHVKIISLGDTDMSRKIYLKNDPVMVGPFGWQVRKNNEFYGPLEIHFSEGNLVLTYQFIEDAQQMPSNIIQASGTRGLAVEKSPDLTNWTTAISVFETNDPKMFYRLKVNQ